MNVFVKNEIQNQVRSKNNKAMDIENKIKEAVLKREHPSFTFKEFRNGLEIVNYSYFLILDYEKIITVPEKAAGLPVLRIGEGVFSDLDGLRTVDIPDSIIEIGEEAFEKSGIESIFLPDSIKSIGAAAFFECYNLERVVLPKNLDTLEEALFYGCESLKDIGSLDGIKKIKNYAFERCPMLPENLKRKLY